MHNRATSVISVVARTQAKVCMECQTLHMAVETRARGYNYTDYTIHIQSVHGNKQGR